MAVQAKEASTRIANASGDQKSRALTTLADMLEQEQGSILQANAKDLQAAEDMGLEKAKVQRLHITEKGIGEMAAACREVSNMSDPVGNIESMEKRPNGMLVGKMRIPLGVVAMIYESRPNVTIDAGIMCIQAGNALILRGGSESFHTNQTLADIFSRALECVSLPREAVQLVPTTDRDAVKEMLHLDEYIDVVIPRGGEGLIRAVVEEASMPVLKHYKGVCHIYVDESADLEQAVEIIHNAKVQKPGVCNAVECLLLHRSVAERILPLLGERLGKEGVLFKADSDSYPLLSDYADKAAANDFGYEFLDLVLAVRVVDSLQEAQEHIKQYGSNHTEAILTRDHSNAMRFLRQVDSSLVLVNASTRFNDGGQLGLGAEIGISTSKLHSYGPMGIKELTSSKFILFGDGQIRAS
ncbi:MAG: glutamate-5-semialdehyde dehydrogenase [Thermodesulfobacteriota bacterium]